MARLTGRSRLLYLIPVLILGIFLLPFVPGFGGCAQDSTAQKKKDPKDKKKDEPKADYELIGARMQPNNLTSFDNYYKAGHWSSITVDALANNFDFQGELQTRPLTMRDAAFEVQSIRPAVLPKGQKRTLESIFFVPRYLHDASIQSNASFGLSNENRINFGLSLTYPGGSRPVYGALVTLREMPIHQSWFLVLATEPERYAYLEKLPAFRSKFNADGLKGSIDDQSYFYRVLRPKIKNRVPVSTNALTWTSTSYLLWDEVSPEHFNLEQQEALIDWLHWGGQLIVSGPGSLNTLSTSFLGPWLPTKQAETDELTLEDLKDVSDQWTQFVFQRRDGKRDLERSPGLRVSKTWACMKFDPEQFAPDTNVVLSSSRAKRLPLIIERTVGRGRILMTSFHLTQPEFKDWQFGDDAFFNACILRRPPREFAGFQGTDSISFRWKRPNNQDVAPQTPREVCQLRYFARDTFSRDSVEDSPPPWLDTTDSAYAQNGSGYPPYYGNPGGFSGNYDPSMVLESRLKSGPRVATWDDYNQVSNLAREALTKSAGIKVPDRWFIVQVMLVYLVVLVPINWLLFWLIGKVEWAWAALPVITIIATGIVVKLAQLNIGFSSARTEIAVLEGYQGYTRAHLTRYLALYTSLSGRYDLKFENPRALVQPFPDGRRPADWQSWLRVRNEIGPEGNVFHDYEIASNSLGLLHTEEMLDLSAPIALTKSPSTGRLQLVNGSQLKLRDVEIWRGGQVARLGLVEPGEARELSFFTNDPAGDTAFARTLGGLSESAEEEPNVPQKPAIDPARMRTIEATRAGLRNLRQAALRDMNSESVRLVAWSDDLFPGITITPAIHETRQANFLLIHLDRPELSTPRPDTQPLSRLFTSWEPLEPTEDFGNPDANKQEQDQ